MQIDPSLRQSQIQTTQVTTSQKPQHATPTNFWTQMPTNARRRNDADRPKFTSRPPTPARRRRSAEEARSSTRKRTSACARKHAAWEEHTTTSADVPSELRIAPRQSAVETGDSVGTEPKVSANVRNLSTSEGRRKI